jgi:hypothetical protein
VRCDSGHPVGPPARGADLAVEPSDEPPGPGDGPGPAPGEERRVAAVHRAYAARGPWELACALVVLHVVLVDCHEAGDHRWARTLRVGVPGCPLCAAARGPVTR